MSYAALALLRRDVERLRAFGLVAVAALLLAVAVGLPSDVAAVFSESSPTLEIHTSAATLAPLDVLRTRSLTVLLDAVLLILVRRLTTAASLLHFTTAAVVAGVLLLAGQLLPSVAAVSERFAVRGYANVALFVLLLLVVTAVMALGRRWGNDGRLALGGNALAAIGILLITAPAAVGDIHLAQTLSSSEELRIPTGQWKVYLYLQQNASPNDVVLAYDWEDVQLLPVYTHVDLYFGDVSFTGRSQTDEVRRYLRAWKFMGYSEALLHERVEAAAKESARLGGADPQHSLERPAAEGPMLLRHLIYDPYIKQFDGVPIRDERTRDLTPSFIERFFALTPSDTAALSADNDVRFLLLSRDYEELRPVPFSAIEGFDLVLRNDVRTLYERQPGH